MKISKREMAKQLAQRLSMKTIEGILAYNVPRAELERLMVLHSLSMTADLCEGCGNIIKSWYDHEVNCKLA
jgi:hypothetical protein